MTNKKNKRSQPNTVEDADTTNYASAANEVADLIASPEEDFVPDDFGVSSSPIEPESHEGELNQVIPFPVSHSRGIGFYPTMSSDAFGLLVSMVEQCVNIYVLATDLCQNNDPSEPDAAIGLASNIASSIEMGFSSLAIKPFSIPEEVGIANTVLGIAEYVYDLKNSSLYPSLIALRDTLNEFKELYPFSLSVNLNNPTYD